MVFVPTDWSQHLIPCVTTITSANVLLENTDDLKEPTLQHIFYDRSLHNGPIEKTQAF
jgi:hypothetical protein